MKLKFFSTNLFVCVLSLIFLISCENNKQVKEVKEIQKEEISYKNNELEPVRELRNGLSAMHINDQKAIFMNLPNEIKSALWKDRLKEAIEKLNLEDSQKELLQDLKDHTTPEIYNPQKNIEFQEYFTNWNNKAKEVFKQEEQEEGEISVQLIVEQLGEASGAKGLLQAKKKPDCTCSIKSDWCPINFKCKPANCVVSAWGCGTLWRFSCDGMCKYVK